MHFSDNLASVPGEYYDKLLTDDKTVATVSSSEVKVFMPQQNCLHNDQKYTEKSDDQLNAEQLKIEAYNVSQQQARALEKRANVFVDFSQSLASYLEYWIIAVLSMSLFVLIIIIYMMSDFTPHSKKYI